ncbi:fasciclin domain-containing protein [Salinimonas iocasae]|uniref:Fasciclin domain-containing protein n=1 Tax=Salinimonas iocasae TaxID=2572577 RepID=A0A5B7Y9X1_9ALTE|nr:fasciclin domain-containing protein [Salinimonas iocasae]QCZ92442.1 fasciclin domain-containing protein [Salinimonas iocasae]
MKTSYIASAAFTAVALTLAAPAMANHHKDKDMMDIVATAKSNPQFSTLATAIQAAGIGDTLKDSGDLTVFAPTNEAFEALPSGKLDMLLKPENKEKLIDVLTYHVVEGKVMASDVMDMDSATSLEGSDIHISVDGDTVMVNDATVIKADVKASNGVIHAIDKVIMPKKRY